MVILSPVALMGLASGALSNPFKGRKDSGFYINPINYRQYEQSLETTSGEIKDRLKQMQGVPSAYWIDVKEKIRAKGTTDDLRTLEGILQDAASNPQPQLCVFIWYDLPNRDCKAHASNGQICCNKNADGSCNYKLGGDCAEGIREYKEEYVDPFIEVLRDFQNRVPIVVVVEPDSLPNLATNVAHPHCGSSATIKAYREGISYSLHQLARETPQVTVYLDAAHGGWMGWENSMEKFMQVLKDMNLPKIRGFATNVANYQPLGIKCPWHPDQGFRNGYCLNGQHQNDPCCEDPCGLSLQWNFGNNELNYAAGLVAAADQQLGWDARVIIDTGRNGVVDHRSTCSNWCNPRGSGAGVKSTEATSNDSLVDAYFWLKTPGESDGCTETLPDGGRCPRFDVMCGAEDSLGSRSGEPRSPEAGHWFDHQVKELAANANFKLPSRTAIRSPSKGPAGPDVDPLRDDCATNSMNCITLGCCKTSGHKCFMKDALTAFCRTSSPSDWYGHEVRKSKMPTGDVGDDSHIRITTTTIADQNEVDDCATNNANCITLGCCKTSGHKCFMKDTLTAFCRTSSPSDWYGHEVRKSKMPTGGVTDGVGGDPHSRITTTTVADRNGGHGTDAGGVADGVGDPHSRITTTMVADRNGGHSNDADSSGTCSPAFGQCGGRNWKGPTCCQSGCHCRHEGDWYSQCEPPAGNHVCASTIEVDDGRDGPVDQDDGTVNSTGSPRLLLMGVPMMAVFGVSLLVVKVVKQRWQPSSDIENGATKPMVLHDDDLQGVE